MLQAIELLAASVLRCFRARRSLLLENLALRQQLAVLEVPAVARSLKIEPVRTSFESAWQNGVAERWVESCRRDLLDHVIALNERHVKRLLLDYVRYYHGDRTHLGLRKGTPGARSLSTTSGRIGRLVSFDRLGGLHHRYDWAA